MCRAALTRWRVCCPARRRCSRSCKRSRCRASCSSRGSFAGTASITRASRRRSRPPRTAERSMAGRARQCSASGASPPRIFISTGPQIPARSRPCSRHEGLHGLARASGNLQRSAAGGRPMTSPARIGPSRIVCLTEETTETLYRLGEEDRIVGISGFTVRPPRARKEKPKVSAFTSAKIDRIIELEPDFAIGFSDIQADIARELIKSGVEVWISNHRSVAGILAYIRRLGAMVGAADKADAYARKAERHVAAGRAAAARLPRRPKVYFEEWDEPIITGIRWVAELIR